MLVCVVVSVPCSLVVICLERADLLAVVIVVFCHFPKWFLVHIEIKCEFGALNWFKPVKYFTDRSKAVLLLWIFYVFSVLCLLCVSVYICFVVTCWERADLLALVCGVLLCVCHFPIGILGQVWYLIVSIPDLCTITYFQTL